MRELTASGYRYTTAPADPSKLDADDLLQGGPALSIEGDVTGGIILSGGNLETNASFTSGRSVSLVSNSTINIQVNPWPYLCRLSSPIPHVSFVLVCLFVNGACSGSPLRALMH